MPTFSEWFELGRASKFSGQELAFSTELNIREEIMTEQSKLQVRDKRSKQQRYRDLLGNFKSGDNISALFKNLEQMWVHDSVYLNERASMFRQCMGKEIERVIASLPSDKKDNYDWLKQQVISHFKETEEGVSNGFRQLHFRPNQAFSEYVAEVKSSMTASLKIMKVGTNYKKLYDIMLRHKVLSTIPDEMAKFLIQEKTENLYDLEKKGAEYVDRHKDASGVGIAGCIGQFDDEGAFHPVRYWSRKLSAAEKNYSTTESEALALVSTVNRFSKYLIGRQFQILTDHRGLVVLNNGTMPASQRLQRWALRLSSFNFRTIYCPARMNRLADYMSRNPNDD